MHDWVGYELVNAGTNFSDGLPLSKPPYATLVAFDMNRGEIAWQVPFGFGEESIRNHPALQGRDAARSASAHPARQDRSSRKGGLVFAGGGDQALFAFDKKTGKEVWHAPPAAPHDRHADDLPVRERTPVRADRDRLGSDQELVAFAIESDRLDPER